MTGKLTVQAGRKYSFIGWPAHIKCAEVLRIGKDSDSEERAFGIICEYDSLTCTGERCETGDWDMKGNFTSVSSRLDLLADIGPIFDEIQSDEETAVDVLTDIVGLHDALEAAIKGGLTFGVINGLTADLEAAKERATPFMIERGQHVGR